MRPTLALDGDMGIPQSTSGVNREMVEWRQAERISSVLTEKVRHWCLEFRRLEEGF